jgi:hypothetical protein
MKRAMHSCNRNRIHLHAAWRSVRCAVSALLCFAACTAILRGEEPPTPSDDERTPLQALIDDSLDEFELRAGPAGDEPLSIAAKLRWDNNARGSASGLTAIYALNGRAQAVVCVYPWNDLLVHEFGSLSRSPLVGERNGDLFWHPEQAGVSFQPIPAADPPRASEGTRLLQMRELARTRFSAQLVGWKADDSDREELRLQTRPLYRYESPGGEVIDGAVFSFVVGVDPEVLLLIEAVDNNGESRWEYAFARRTSGELLGRLDNAVVWRADRFPNSSDSSAPFHGATRPLPEQVRETLQQSQE